MAAATPEVGVGGACGGGLRGVEGSQLDVQKDQQLVEAATQNRITDPIDDRRGLNVAGCQI